jgi:hypothetical protein
MKGSPVRIRASASKKPRYGGVFFCPVKSKPRSWATLWATGEDEGALMSKTLQELRETPDEQLIAEHD